MTLDNRIRSSLLGVSDMRLERVRQVIGLVLVALLSLGITACTGTKNFSKEDFKKVEKGMSEDKVKEILGKPFDDAEALGVKRLWWKVGDDYYSVAFKDGKVESAEGPSKKEEYEIMKGLMKAVK